MLNPLHPRPQLQRESWVTLDGWWDFAAAEDLPDTFEHSILVPYSPESPRSGVQNSDFHTSVWYRTRLEVPAHLQPAAHEDLILHFGAVDHIAKVWVNGAFLGEHEGGYTPFRFPVTSALQGSSTLEIVVQALDFPADLTLPRGKQDWHREPHSIWYPRTTGIWRTVWLEKAPKQRIEKAFWSANVERFEIGCRVQVTGQDNHKVQVRLFLRGEEIASQTTKVNRGWVNTTLHLPDPGIDDARDDLMWSPEHPQLLEAEITLLNDEGQIVDLVASYTALRSVALRDHSFFLNNRPYPLRLALDQGYWTEGHATASAEELQQDVLLSKQLGFNGVRKHQKIEDPRFLFQADRLGLLVWTEMPSPYTFTPEVVGKVTRQWQEVLERDVSHPCVVTWVVFNESWGVPDLPVVEEQRAFVRAMYHLTRAYDPTRPVVGNDGWEHVVTDILSIHDYEARPEVLLQHYSSLEHVLDHTLRRFRPGNRELMVEGCNVTAQPIMLTEFGGIAYTATPQQGWGYSTAQSSEDFIDRYEKLMAAVHACKAFAGFCYTQLTDTFQEINGILTMDRQPKADIARFAQANLGPRQRYDAANPLGYSKRWLAKEPTVLPETLSL